MATAKKQKSITFFSKYPGYTLIRKNPRHVRDAAGDVIGTTGPEEGESPWEVQFNGPFFTTDDSVLIDFLRGHNDFNKVIWEQGNAPDEPRPTAKEQLETITSAAMAQDRKVLDELIATEKATHGRASIIQQAEFARDQIVESSGTGDSKGVINKANGSPNSDKTT